MAIICVTITQSEAQVVSGIPRTVSIVTNISSTIFYTLDGTTPNLFSTMYTGPIFLPYDKFLVTLKVLATNGVSSSPIVCETYQTNIVDGNARLPHAATTAEAGHVLPDTYPFGTPPYQPDQGYLNPALSGVTVYNPRRPAQPTAFNADGYGAAYTNEPYNVLNYQIVYTDKNAEGEQGRNIGNIPGYITKPYPSDIQPNVSQVGADGPEETNQFTATFDPRAFVIFQDFSKEDPNDPPMINRQYFTLEDPERARDGTFYFNTGLDATAPISGSFLHAFYNNRTGEITHYYRDSWTNRWIISTAPYQPNHNASQDLAVSAVGRSSKVFEWIPFARRVLF
jgi:hypothetical protein